MHNPISNEIPGLSVETIDTLYEYGMVKTFAEGDIIMNVNSYIRVIPIVLKGSIRVMRIDDEKEMLLYYIRPGESCIMSFLGGLHHEKSTLKAIAEEEVELLLIPIDRVAALIKDNAEWLDYIFKLYHKRFEELLLVVNDVAFKKTDERILNFLKEKQKLSQTKEIHITHQQLAEEIGTARVVVSRLLKQMETNGLVKLGRNKIWLM
jgi:CRP/FNR family transcriptional regulator